MLNLTLAATQSGMRLREGGGTVYVAFAVDTFSRRIVGWSAANSKATPLVLGALDNALMEPTIGLYKTGLIKRRSPWRTLTDVELGTAEWVDWYNNRRLRGEIGHVPPVEYETGFYLTQPNPQLEPQP